VKVDTTKLKRIDMSGLAHPKPGKRVKGKGIKSPLQKKKDNPRSKYWKTKADKLWGELIHRNKTCLIGIGCKGNLEAHHLITRSRVLTRHSPENGVLLCSLHHKFSTDISAHMAPIEFSLYLIGSHPEKIAWVTKNKHNMGQPDYIQAYDKLRSLLDGKKD